MFLPPTKDYARLLIGKRYTAHAPGAYRYGHPFTVVSISLLPGPGPLTYVYIVRYDDGEIDCFPVKGEGGFCIQREDGAPLDPQGE
jgi:hypothetical protein